MTKEFKSLKPSGLSDAFNAEVDGSAPIIEVEVGEDQITIACIFPGFDLSDDEQDVKGEKKPFKEVGISGTGFVSESGHPLMPVFRRFVNVPRGCNVEVNVEKGKAVTFDDILVTPAQEEAFDGEEDHEFEFDEEAYNKDEFYPKDIVKISSPQDVDGYNAVLVEICPLQFNSAGREIRGYGNIKAILKFSAKAKDKVDGESEYSFMDPELEKEGFGNLLLNPGRKTFPANPLGWGMPTSIRTRTEPYEHQFLIIYHSRFETAARKLADWKNTKGISTEIVDIATVGSNSTAKIKKYIRDRRKQGSSSLRYVLLFGDTTHILMESGAGETTDYYYSTPRDPSSISDCVAPNIAIGRIPVQTRQEALDVVDQVINYEKTPPCDDAAYYERITVAAHFWDDPPQDGKADRTFIKTMEGIRRHLVAAGKEVQRVYVSNNPNPQRYKDGTEVPLNVKNAIVDADTATDMLISEASDGQLLMAHRGLGRTTGWVHPPFGIDDLDAITSTCPSIFFTVNGSTGRFQLHSTRDCFAESILKLKGGAPSLIAATKVSGTWRNNNFIKALFDGLFPGIIRTYPTDTTAAYAIKNNRLGDIHNYAKIYLLVAHGPNTGVRKHLQIYHLIGDPTLELWNAMPLIINITLKLRDENLLIRLNALPRDGIIVIKEGDRIITKVKTSSRLITVSLKDLKVFKKPGIHHCVISACFSAPGYRYIEKKLKIKVISGMIKII